MNPLGWILGLLILAVVLGVAVTWGRARRGRQRLPALAAEQLLDALDESVLVFSSLGDLLWANAVARQRFHLPSSGAAVPQRLPLLFQDYPALADWVLQPVRSRPTETLLRIETEQGVRHWRVRMVGVQWQGQVSGKMVYIWDVTPRQEATDRLQLRLQQTRWVSRLLELSFRPEPLEETLREALQIFLQPLETFRVRASALYTYDATTDTFRLLTTVGLSAEHFQDFLPGSRVPDMETSPQNGRFCLRDSLPLASWVFPLRLGEERQGLLWLATERPEPPSPAQRMVLQQAAYLLTLLLRSKAVMQDRIRLGQAFKHDVDGLLIFRLEDGQPVFGNPAVEGLTGHPWTESSLPRDLLQAIGPWEQVVERLRAGEYLEGMHEWDDGNETRILRVLAFAVVVPPSERPDYGVLTLQDLTEHEGLIRQLRKHTNFIEHLLWLSQAMLEGRMRMVDVLRRILQTTQEMVDAEGGTLILVDEERAPYAVFTGQELFPASAFTRRVVQEGLASWVLEQRTGLVVMDAPRDTRWISGEFRTWRAVLCVPIFYGEMPLAVLTLTHTRPAHFHDEHLRLMEAAADIMALALYTARLYEEQYFLTQQLATAKEEAEDLHRRQEQLFRLLGQTLRPSLEHIQREWTRLEKALNTRVLPPSIAHLREIWQEVERLLSRWPGQTPSD